MKIKRSHIIKKFPWIVKKNQQYIISASYDGLICAAFLKHFLNWELVGYYNFENLWISKKAKNNKNNIIWIDLNILPIKGRAIGGHIVAYNNQIPKGFDTSCNPNTLIRLSEKDFQYKYPFSTIVFLMWLHNKYVVEKAKFTLFHSDDVWLKYQKYNSNCKLWQKALTDYDWDLLFEGIEKKSFEKKVSQKYYPFFESNHFFNQTGKIKSKYYNITSKQLWFNPDWDEDIILNLCDYFAQTLDWEPPKLPSIDNRIDGIKNKIALSKVKSQGISHFINSNNVFSYAITSTKTLSYTVFNNRKNKPL